MSKVVSKLVQASFFVAVALVSARLSPRETGENLERAAAKDERKTEAHMGRPLKKGEERFEER